MTFWIDWAPVRHGAAVLNVPVFFRLRPRDGTTRRALARALSRAVGQLRAVERVFGKVQALPGGGDAGELLLGWGLQRAAGALRDAGFGDFAMYGGDKVLAAGTAPHGGAWRAGVRHAGDPHGIRTMLALDDEAAARRGSLVVVGRDLAVADAYAAAAGDGGSGLLNWFPTPDGYRAVLLDAPDPEPQHATAA